MELKIVYLVVGPLLDYCVVMAAGYGPSITPTALSCSACALADTMTLWASCTDRAVRVPAVHQPGDGGPVIERQHIDSVKDFG